MIKLFLSAIVLVTFTATSFGQTTSRKIDQSKNDPKTTENAAKADASLINQKNIMDSNVLKNKSIKRKEKSCRSKRKNKSTCTSL